MFSMRSDGLKPLQNPFFLGMTIESVMNFSSPLHYPSTANHGTDTLYGCIKVFYFKGIGLFKKPIPCPLSAVWQRFRRMRYLLQLSQQGVTPYRYTV